MYTKVLKGGALPVQIEVINDSRDVIQALSLELRAEVTIRVQNSTDVIEAKEEVLLYAAECDGCASGRSFETSINVPFQPNSIGNQSMSTPNLDIKYFFRLRCRTGCFASDASLEMPISLSAYPFHRASLESRASLEARNALPVPASAQVQDNPIRNAVVASAPLESSLFRTHIKVNGNQFQTLGNIPIATPIECDDSVLHNYQRLDG